MNSIVRTAFFLVLVSLSVTACTRTLGAHPGQPAPLKLERFDRSR